MNESIILEEITHSQYNQFLWSNSLKYQG